MSPLERRDNRVHVDKGVLMRAFRILRVYRLRLTNMPERNKACNKEPQWWGEYLAVYDWMFTSDFTLTNLPLRRYHWLLYNINLWNKTMPHLNHFFMFIIHVLMFFLKGLLNSYQIPYMHRLFCKLQWHVVSICIYLWFCTIPFVIQEHNLS